jgi:molybdopterin-guanine dinucleotide biosynthesis protein A
MQKNVKPGGIILLGGKSERMGTDKYLLPFFSLTLIEVLVRELEKATVEVILITNEPEKISFLSNEKFGDIYSVPSALSGLHAGLRYSNYETNFVLACDLPLFDARMVSFFCDQLGNSHAVIPRTSKGYEPLCALYSRTCLPTIERMFEEKNYAIQSLLDRIPVVTVPSEKIEAITHSDVFMNMNTPDEYRLAIQKIEQKKSPAKRRAL